MRSVSTSVHTRAFLAIAAAALGVAGCASGGGQFAGPSWNLTGGKDAARLPQRPLTSSPPVDAATARSAPRPQVTQVPAATHAPSAAASRPQSPRAINVQHGQSLASIAAEHRVSIASLMAANGLRDVYIVPGQTLVIPRH